MRIPLHKNIEARKSEHHGIGLFAKDLIKKGEVLGKMTGKRTHSDGIHVLWTSDRSGILVNNILKYSNHNWENPNTELAELKLIALRDILPNEEITWDYSCGYKYEQNLNLSKPLYDNIGLSIIHHSIIDNNLKVFTDSLKIIFEKDLRLVANMDDEESISGDLEHWVFALGSIDIIQEFKKYPYNLEKKTKDGYNILHLMYMFNNKDTIKNLTSILPEKTLNSLLSERDSFGNVPLDYSI